MSRNTLVPLFAPKMGGFIYWSLGCAYHSKLEVWAPSSQNHLESFLFYYFFNCHTLDQLNHNRWGPGCFKICPGELWSAADNRWWGSSGAICRSPARETERPTLIHFLFLLQSGCAYTMGSKGLRAPGAVTALGLTALWARKALKPMVHC